MEALESRWLFAAVTLDTGTTFQTIQGWGTAAVYPTNLVTVAQAGTIMRDAGMNVVRVTPGPNDYAYTVGGNMRTPVPISANLDENVARFNPNSNNQTDLIDWLETYGLEPDRTMMIGSLWSPPHWMKITTGTLLNWDNGGPQSGYDPIIPWGDYGGNTGAGRVNPAMWTDWARYVLSTVKSWEQKTGLPMYAFSFQNEPNVPTTYNSASFQRIANDVNNPSAGGTDFHWELYGDAVQALATELASHPEITTKFFGPELSQLGGGATNPYNLPAYNAIRQNLISRGLLDVLGAYATHEYTYPADSSVMWDAWYNGSQHAANIVNGTNNLGWLGPTPGIKGDNKEIWQTETEGEDQTWTKDGAMGFGLKIFNSLVYGNVSGYTSWTLTGYDSNDPWGLVDLDDINNPTNSFKYDAFKQFSRWIRPGAQRINATFENGKASIGGANELDTYNGLNVSAFNHAQDKRLTMVLVNMRPGSESTTITIPSGLNVSSFQVFQTTGTQKYVQLADLTPSNGQITINVPGSGFVTITGTYDTPTLPANWSSNDIGSPALTGSSGLISGNFVIRGAGYDIWNNFDQFQFANTSLTGNGSIIARVTDLQGTDPWAKAGLMFRNSLDAGSVNALMAITPGNGATFQYRSSFNGSSSYSNQTGYAAPYWLKLTRTGSTFTGYRSADGVTWTLVGSTTLAMNNTVYVGLAVTSHNGGLMSTGTFSNVLIDQAPTVAIAASSANPVNATVTNLTVLGADDAGESKLTYTWTTTGSPPAPVSFSANGTNAAKSTTATFTTAGSYSFLVTIADALGGVATSAVNVQVSLGGLTSAHDIGAPALPGSLVFNPTSGAYSISGGGADIWNQSDQFYFARQSWSGDAQLTVRVDSLTNTNTWAKAGVMLRETTAANSRFAMVAVTPSQGVTFQWRTTTGGSAAATTIGGANPPRWVRLCRVGNTFTAFDSSDGITWSQVGAQTIAMAAATQAGLAVTSHDNSKLATAGFSNFALSTVDTVAPTLSSVVSRKAHGSAGTFDLGLSLGASPTIEPRSGGPNWLVFNFSETIRAADGLLSASEFGLTNASFDSATITNNVLVLRLKNVVNQSRVTVNLLGLVDAAGNALAGTSSVIIRSLYGDVNRSGSVSTADQQAVKNGLLQTVSAANYLLDLNLSGTISVTDQQIVKNALFTSVP